MKAIKVNPVSLPNDRLAEMKKRSAKLSDVKLHIQEEAWVHIDGRPVAVYKKIDVDILPMLFSCLFLKFPKYERTSGLVTETVNINYSPRNPTRSNMCQPSDLLVSHPMLHEVFAQYGQIMDSYYRKYFRKAHENQFQASRNGNKKVDPTYLIEDTVFTGGVINKDSALSYHRDLANTRDGISCMIILKKYARGGELVIPELGISFECKDGYVLLFDGQKYLHGVTPIKLSKKGYRYTIVYYNNNGMSLCLPPKEELEHFENYNIQQALKAEQNEH